MILVDTSIWIDHIRQSQPELERALVNNKVLMHPYVLAEIALGSIANRSSILQEMKLLPVPLLVNDSEIMLLIEQKDLAGAGIGFVDTHLIASAMVADELKLWTRDKRLGAVARRLGIAFQPLH